MAIDTYAPCPGGTGKKIKFCCSDLVGDLEQLDRLVEGEQYAAALAEVKRLAARHPGRACLLATQAKLELAGKDLAGAAATSRAFLDACPDNPIALGQAAVTEAVAGRGQEAAALFDKAREVATAAGQDALTALVPMAGTLVQAAAQLGHPGFAQGIVDWLVDGGLGGAEDLRLLAAIVGSSGVPAALRTRRAFLPEETESPWRFEFSRALEHASHWRLSRALTTFRSLKGVAAESRPLFTNIAILCEMLARPYEAAEAWLAVARMRETPAADAVEVTGRAVALETEADPDRSPQVRFTSVAAALAVAAGEDGTRAIELLEDGLRHDPRCDPAAFDRSTWVSRGAVPPRSAWRIYELPAGELPGRLLATLLIFGRQTDREPEAVLQGFLPDVDAARPAAEQLLGCRFAAAVAVEGMPSVTPTTWLLGGQFRLPAPTTAPPPARAGEPAFYDRLIEEQRRASWGRFLDVWPDLALPELLGKTPREALRDAEGGRRVEALITEGEATSRRSDASQAWTAVRGRLGLAAPEPIVSARPLEEVPPMRWHRLDLAALPLEQLRGVFVTAVDAGFELAAERTAEALRSRSDASTEDRCEALSFLEERADSTVRKLEIIAELRAAAKPLKAGDGMIDVAELRVRLQRGDEADIVRLLDHVRREHQRDPQVLQAVAQVLAEAGVDLGSLAARGGAAAAGPAAQPPLPAAEPGKIWTPGGEPAAPAGEKKVIWTP